MPPPLPGRRAFPGDSALSSLSQVNVLLNQHNQVEHQSSDTNKWSINPVVYMRVW